MDYLNYGKQVQQKPQPQGFIDVKQKNKPQPQRSQPQSFQENFDRQDQPQVFGQQKVQLTSDDFNFGNLNSNHQAQQQVQSEPTKSNQPNPNLFHLFPIPVLIKQYPYEYSKELDWINTQKSRNNTEQLEYGAPKEERLIVHNQQSENTFLLDDPIMQNVRKFILEEVNAFAKDILGLESEMVITQSWFNKNQKGMQHHEHIHPNSIISGVWYPQIDESLPPIKFRNTKQAHITGNIVNYNNFNSATFLLPMRNGELILFPSTLSHSVPTNFSDKVRFILSFNTWCKGSMGDERSLKYLPLDRCV